MRIGRYLRIIAFSLVVVSPILLQTGCGGNGDGGDTGTALSPEDDPTLNPETDSTLNSEADSTVEEDKEGKKIKE